MNAPDSDLPTGEDIADLRGQIDAIDDQLVRLLNERATVAKQIGAFKHREGLPIYSPEREDRLLRGLADKNAGRPLPTVSLLAIYREIMSAALALEKNIAIACLGPVGSATHQAAREKFGSSVSYRPLATVGAVFREVITGESDCGVVPLDEAGHGTLNATLDCLAESDIQICAQIFAVMDEDDPERSRTRFLVLGGSLNPPSERDATMILLRVEDKPGALIRALEPFREHEINLQHVANRPASKGSQDVFFFVEAEGHSRDLQTSNVFRDLSMRCRAVKLLGSYPCPATAPTGA